MTPAIIALVLLAAAFIFAAGYTIGRACGFRKAMEEFRAIQNDINQSKGPPTIE